MLIIRTSDHELGNHLKDCFMKKKMIQVDGHNFTVDECASSYAGKGCEVETVCHRVVTPEQKRNKAIAEMQRIIERVPEGESRLAHLYDAGFRRPEGT